MSENNAWCDMAATRANQVEIGFTADHDDQHDAAEWMALLSGLLGEAGYLALDVREAAGKSDRPYSLRHKMRAWRWRIVKVSATALAAAEAADRFLAKTEAEADSPTLDRMAAASPNTTPGTPVGGALLERHIEAVRANSQVMTRTAHFVMSPVDSTPDTPVLFVRIADPDGSPTHCENDGMLSLANLDDIERLNADRRMALSILHQIYDLGIDPKSAHIAARARALLDSQA